MSWFKKNKPISETACMSGVATCDGKRHVWSPWKDVVLGGVIWKRGMGEPMPFNRNAQERTCLICNYRERREL